MRSLAFVLTILATLLPPGVGLACSCSQRPLEEHVRRTPTIFEGRVVDVARAAEPRGSEPVRARIEVSTRWKGDVPAITEVHSHSASAACGFAQFPAGQTMLILAYPRHNGGGFATDLCTMGPTYGSRRSALDRVLDDLARNRETLERTARDSPRPVLPLMRLARFLEDWRDYPAAARAYAAAGEDVPDLQAAHAGQGRVLFAAGGYQDAIARLERAVAVPSQADAESRRLLGQARFHLGDRSVIGTMDFRELVMPDMDLAGQDLPGRDFTRARLERARFDGSRLARARFVEAWLSGASFARADLTGADLQRAQGARNFTGARLDGAVLSGAFLSGAALDGASLRDVAGQDANLGQVSAAGAILVGARLPLASLHRANLTDADFTDAILAGASLAGAGLCGANLATADLRGADLRDARYDDATRLPPGFDPTTAGMVPVTRETCAPASFFRRPAAAPDPG